MEGTPDRHSSPGVGTSQTGAKVDSASVRALDCESQGASRAVEEAGEGRRRCGQSTRGAVATPLYAAEGRKRGMEDTWRGNHGLTPKTLWLC